MTPNTPQDSQTLTADEADRKSAYDRLRLKLSKHDIYTDQDYDDLNLLLSAPLPSPPEQIAPAIEALETLVATSGHPYKDGLAAVIKSALSSGYCIIEPAPPMLETLQGREAAALIKKYADCGVANPTLSALMEAVGKNRVYEARDLFAENAKNSPPTNEPVAVEVDANDHTMGGSLVFKGSRILVSSIVKWVRQGASNDDIMAAYPDLTNDQIEGVRGFLDAANEPVGVTDDMTPPPTL